MTLRIWRNSSSRNSSPPGPAENEPRKIPPALVGHLSQLSIPLLASAQDWFVYWTSTGLARNFLGARLDGVRGFAPDRSARHCRGVRGELAMATLVSRNEFNVYES